MASGIEINRNGSTIRIALGTAAAGTPTTVDQTGTYAAIVIDLGDLEALLTSSGITNLIMKPVLLQFYDATNSCALTQMIVLGTEPQVVS